MNAHDHLEFNLFPQLGRGPYRNASLWAEDIHRSDGDTIRNHSAVPKALRLWWGGIKNLLCGATTVCHHNPFEDEVFDSSFPVRVVRNFGWTHSLAFGRKISAAFRVTPDSAPFILHLAEGTDASSRDEIFTLDKLGFLDSRTVIVHGVGLDQDGQALLSRRGAAIIWCPTSNGFTLGKTLDYGYASKARKIAVGSDSALTSRGDLIDEVKFATKEGGLSPSLVYSMVSDGAADVLRLKNGEGMLREGAVADFIIMAWRGSSPAETLARATFKDIHAVVVGGQLNLVTFPIAGLWPEAMLEGLEPITIEGNQRWVRAPVSELLAATKHHLGNSIRLAGKRVTS
ncbi:MAG: amidohydrolase family protein [Acidobacteria bacterium]|nr:amidohydrolase family protein [Acidobacteriota bacterium]